MHHTATEAFAAAGAFFDGANRAVLYNAALPACDTLGSVAGNINLPTVVRRRPAVVGLEHGFVSGE
jgi:hypothetical protein